MVIKIEFLQIFGDLINFQTGAIKNDLIYSYDEKFNVYDTQQQCWKMMTANQIPWTYTYARHPINFRQEARLWLRAAHRVKHRYIWARVGIPRDEFARLMSRQNIENYNRYLFVNI